MHFLKRQYWHLLRCAFVISQLPSATHVYTRLFCTVRLKKPLHLETTKTDPTSSRPEPKFPFTLLSVLVTAPCAFHFVNQHGHLPSINMFFKLLVIMRLKSDGSHNAVSRNFRTTGLGLKWNTTGVTTTEREYDSGSKIHIPNQRCSHWKFNCFNNQKMEA